MAFPRFINQRMTNINQIVLIKRVEDNLTLKRIKLEATYLVVDGKELMKRRRELKKRRRMLK